MCHLWMKLSDMFDHIILCSAEVSYLVTKVTKTPEKAGKLNVNNNKVMCHLSVKISDMFDQNPPVTIHKIREKLITIKNSLTA